MTWQRYKLNLRNSLLLEEYFRVMEQFAFVSEFVKVQAAHRLDRQLQFPVSTTNVKSDEEASVLSDPSHFSPEAV